MCNLLVLVLYLNIWYRLTVPFSQTYEPILKKRIRILFRQEKQSAMYCTRLRNQRDVLDGYVMCRRVQTVNFLLTRGVIAARLRNT